MENTEIYFRTLDTVIRRESFLEKEMIDSDVRYLESHSQFFDKLVVLAAGSLTIGISFLIAGFEHASVEAALRRNLIGISVSIGLFVVSLVLCVLHNFEISRAVGSLSSQVEFTYQAAQRYRRFREAVPYNAQISMYPADSAQVSALETIATTHQQSKNARVRNATWLGLAAMATLIVAYVLSAVGIVIVLAGIAT